MRSGPTTPHSAASTGAARTAVLTESRGRTSCGALSGRAAHGNLSHSFEWCGRRHRRVSLGRAVSALASASPTQRKEVLANGQLRSIQGTAREQHAPKPPCGRTSALAARDAGAAARGALHALERLARLLARLVLEE